MESSVAESEFFRADRRTEKQIDMTNLGKVIQKNQLDATITIY